MSESALQTSLDALFIEGIRWPIDRGSLAALIDMGLSNAQIGKYFSVSPDDVYMLREDYGL